MNSVCTNSVCRFQIENESGVEQSLTFTGGPELQEQTPRLVTRDFLGLRQLEQVNSQYRSLSLPGVGHAFTLMTSYQ